MEKLSLLLLRTLSEHDGFMTSKAAAAELGVSRKTVRRYAEEINQHQERYGCMIQAKKGSGLYLQITNEEAFQRRKEQASHNDDFVSRIIEFFIQEETYIKSEMLCERLFISQSKLSQELKKLRRILSHYQLSIQTKPYYGMKLSGSEFDLRRFMASNYLQRTHIKQLEEGTISEDTPSLLHQQIKAIVSSEFSQKAYPMSEAILNNLVNHLAIAVLRMQSGRYLDRNLPISGRTNDEQTLLGERIIARIEKECTVHFTEYERNYVLGQIVGKRVVPRNEKMTVSDEAAELVSKILKAIKESRQIDFSKDLDLQTMLMLHFAPLIDRIELGIELKNPLLNEVKVHCNVAYDLAIIAGQVIAKQFEKTISDHELSYLAMHFDVALNKKDSQTQRKYILVVNDLGRATNTFLKEKFEFYFRNYIKKVTVCNQYEFLQMIEEQEFDFIFSSIPLPYEGTIPVMNVDYFMQPDMNKKIEAALAAVFTEEVLLNYFRESLFICEQEFETKEAVLHFLCQQIKEQYSMPENFETLVFEREAFFGTDFLPSIAFPHPNALIGSETVIAVANLKKPVFWYKQTVRLVFLLVIAEQDHLKVKPLNDHLIKQCSSLDKVNKLAATTDFMTFINFLKE